VFLPRPLVLVEQLPRNATGKLPHQVLQSLAERHLRASGALTPALDEPAEEHSELSVAYDHASFAGHFPGSPILPGAVLLDEALREIGRSRRIDLTQWRVASAKFLEPVRPGDELTLQHAAPRDGTIRFVIRAASRTVASGVLSVIASQESHGP
jgi:3-hydroxymyristoyl/3-hydroxydecanoyl-(acyl carrier protein) dehydratase